MDIFEMRYVKVLSEMRNFSHASEALFITQSALSQQINKIEKNIGFPLFKRSSRQVSLTPAGEELMVYIDRVLAANDLLTARIHGIHDSLSHRIKLASSQFIGPVISGVLAEFHQKHPEINLEYSELFNKNIYEEVHKGNIDLAILPLISKRAVENQVYVYPIKHEYICAIVHNTHPLARKSEITLEDLTHYQLIFSSVRTGLKDAVFKALEDNNLKAGEPFDITSEATRMPFLKGGAITFSLNGTFSWANNNDIEIIPVSPRINCDIALITPMGRIITPPMNDLMELIKKAINNETECLN